MRRSISLLAGTAFVLSIGAWAVGSTSGLMRRSSLIAQTTRYDSLTIAPDSVPIAPEGKQLTLTVDGVELPIAPGQYRGNVLLTVTDDIPVQYRELPVHHFRSALYVENGVPVAAKSVLAALGSGQATNGKVELPRVLSHGERFNGIVVTGEGKYVIDHPVINLEGNGGNDFAGFGAAIMATGKADVTVERPIIRTNGAVRTALFVGGDSTMRVNNAEIEVFNGTLPADYTFTIEVGRMMEVPWMLGLSGNVRATNLVGNGTLYLTNSHVRAQGWGALSTDDSSHVRMYVKDSLIQTLESGYGSYSIGDSHNVFDHSIIHAADIGSIIAGEGSITFTNETIVNAGRYGVMMHSGVGGGTLTIDKGSELLSRETAIEVKGRGTTIVVDNAKVRAGNGVILQAMENDDPYMKAMMSNGAGPGASAGTDPPLGMTSGPPPSPDVVATFRNTKLVGDFFNGRTTQGDMTLRFQKTSITGRITTSTVAPASGREPTRETYREIGRVTNTPAPSATAHGLTVSLDATSQWTVTGTSYLSSLQLQNGARIDGGDKKLRMLVDGREVSLRPGRYQGAITLELR